MHCQKSQLLGEFQAETLYVCPKHNFSFKFSSEVRFLLCTNFERIIWRARETLAKHTQTPWIFQRHGLGQFAKPEKIGSVRLNTYVYYIRHTREIYQVVLYSVDSKTPAESHIEVVKMTTSASDIQTTIISISKPRLKARQSRDRLVFKRESTYLERWSLDYRNCPWFHSLWIPLV